ncbi:LysR family transcriptional regulator [Falsiroseomonas sp.]|uniref:LysR family transcriptional regulator n=1 Tax=Falsiroseomonas sp. TaxID=2870721 RepID=UPI00271F808C|nr:LysR family transcriptional regulator [Falsiroseomonas sp.]MDO9500579.1 LysR family transcriptional regulator [Falsiroseomonas sp.]
MNLRAADLNLLVVLDALLEEAHVSRAALRLGLSQPAMSAALERCRPGADAPRPSGGGGVRAGGVARASACPGLRPGCHARRAG